MKDAPIQEHLSVQIRAKAIEDFVIPARKEGRSDLVISVRELMRRFPADFSKNRQSVFCTALRAKAFLKPNGLSLEQIEGPEKQRGTSVIYHYRFEQKPAPVGYGPMSERDAARHVQEVLAPLRGLLKEEIAAFGGTEAFIRWVRSDEPTR